MASSETASGRGQSNKGGDLHARQTIATDGLCQSHSLVVGTIHIWGWRRAETQRRHDAHQANLIGDRVSTVHLRLVARDPRKGLPPDQFPLSTGILGQLCRRNTSISILLLDQEREDVEVDDGPECGILWRL